MCGIVGYAGGRMAVDILLDGLKRLEYRGYDSVGVAIASEGLKVFKDKGEISKIEPLIPRWNGQMGIGHTRWATCGRPSKENALPFVDCTGRIALVHNGIIENHLELRK
ncbi:MAG TPA: glutamine--fructose-6-phosphate aminotransferase, partial [Methanomassiliicoccaceae archaeon]|nr:glutamine--fructose-6-phosphate aminotransferase [Methanomassiliicoccaceae archaeon]